MGKQALWQKVIVDWDAHQYAMIDPLADEQEWTDRVGAEQEKGRDIHCFHHDAADTSGLLRWAKQHELAATDANTLLPGT